MPDIAVTVRSDIDPTKVRHKASAEADFYFHDGRRRVLLIHGFRTDTAKAYRNYHLFRAQAAAISRQFEADMFGFAWPGDTLGWNVWNYFEDNVDAAGQSGACLADFLRDILRRPGPPMILIAHSLGCLVTIEALQKLHAAEFDYTRKLSVFLMAPAFPKDFVEPGGSHADALGHATHSGCFYSPDDKILSRWFQIGHHWSTQEACGLHGAPACERWTTPAKHKAGYKHTDYWQDAEGEISHAIAKICGYGDLTQPSLPEVGDLRRARIKARAPLGERTMR